MIYRAACLMKSIYDHDRPMYTTVISSDSCHCHLPPGGAHHCSSFQRWKSKEMGAIAISLQAEMGHQVINNVELLRLSLSLYLSRSHDDNGTWLELLLRHNRQKMSNYSLKDWQRVLFLFFHLDLLQPMPKR